MKKTAPEDDKELPWPYELQDLFQFRFNQFGSCINKFDWPPSKIDMYEASDKKGDNIWDTETQSVQLFIKKFGGTIGLLKKLKSYRETADGKEIIGLNTKESENLKFSR